MQCNHLRAARCKAAHTGFEVHHFIEIAKIPLRAASTDHSTCLQEQHGRCPRTRGSASLAHHEKSTSRLLGRFLPPHDRCLSSVLVASPGAQPGNLARSGYSRPRIVRCMFLSHMCRWRAIEASKRIDKTDFPCRLDAKTLELLRAKTSGLSQRLFGMPTLRCKSHPKCCRATSGCCTQHVSLAPSRVHVLYNKQ